MPRSEPPPAERVRRRIASSLGPAVAAQLPSGYQRIGRVLVVQLPEGLRPVFQTIGEAWRTELRVGAVLRRAGAARGEFRVPHHELIAGEDTCTEVVEYGIRYRLDAQRLLFARGNRAERHRAGTVTRPGETVADLFAGIGYFTLPAAVAGRAGRVWAVEKNPASFEFLSENVRRNHVADRVECIRGDNREVELPLRGFDRVFLGYLPSAVPWVPRALALLKPSGGVVHVHLVTDLHGGAGAADATVRLAAEQSGAAVKGTSVRFVKSYGPGRQHAVVDLTAYPTGSA